MRDPARAGHANDTNNVRIISMREQRVGFTLIELLIVIGIVATLAVFGSLALFGTRRAQNLQFDAERIAAVLRTAQENSILQEEDSEWGVCFHNQSDPGLDYYELVRGSEGTCTGGTPATRYTLSQSVRLPDVSPAEFTIVFLRITGLIDIRSGDFISIQNRNNPSESKTITVSRGNGLINIQ